jgi:hypothetical protein
MLAYGSKNGLGHVEAGVALSNLPALAVIPAQLAEVSL